MPGLPLKGLGFAPELPPDARAAKFRTLTAADQMPWLKRYYAPYRGQAEYVTACYLSHLLCQRTLRTRE